jgi:tripartite-type tricarboxylate transporter receptor subunit TctC
MDVAFVRASAGRSIVRAVLFALLGVGLVGTARAEYPDRALNMIVCFAAGGASDTAARLIADPLSQALGKPVTVENRGGGGGNIGIAAAAHAAHDGYTLLLCSSAFVVNPSLYSKASYDPYKDLVPIITIASSPNVIVVSGKSDIKTLPEFIAKAKASGGRMNWSSPGLGTTPFLAGEALKLRTGIDMQHIPFAGGGPAGMALLGGSVEMMSVTLGSVLSFIDSGEYRPLAQTGKERWVGLPNVPTFGELGIENAESETFQAIWAPGGTPQPVVDRLAKEIGAILRRPDMRERFLKMGLGVLAEPPEVMRARIAREIPMYKEIIDKAGLKVN